MRAPITDKHLLEMMWERFPEIMQRGTEQPEQEPAKYSDYEPDGVHHNKPEQDTVQRLSALVRAQQITIDKLEAQLEQEPFQPDWANFEEGRKVGRAEALEDGQKPVAVYGYCPQCGAKGVMRERRPNGNDKCANGHTYPSSTSTPPQRTWVDLPDEEIKILWIQYRAALPRYLCFAKALLARAKEENT